MSGAVDAVLDQPLLWLVVTLLAYQLGLWLRGRTGAHPLAQPVLVAIVVVGALVVFLDVDYASYAEDTAVITFVLGPATVALAVPLHRQLARLRGFVLPLLTAVVAGAAVSVAAAVGLVRLLGGDELLARSMAPKATTTPVSIAVSETLGGLPPLTAALTITAGILGAVAGPGVLGLLRVRDHRARGLAVGSASHGIGTGRMIVDHPVEGAFSGLAMGLTALVTSVVAPLLVALLL
ncbi:putative murein hydrolase (TIGR00659 family) [Nocardioides salarius]|uniref:Murein hydrolase (TIGR00659 family) n=1 Tax=Nocardioides salarius TaxID=374513 RepID=A0ABS2MCC2_9ACTN|nr:LrgB family protein [Nocardioides salarius]MBM7508837.1 putative murein hydrolase (TIGR00659 family) [Nocardioides salarius]